MEIQKEHQTALSGMFKSAVKSVAERLVNQKEHQTASSSMFESPIERLAKDFCERFQKDHQTVLSITFKSAGADALPELGDRFAMEDVILLMSVLRSRQLNNQVDGVLKKIEECTKEFRRDSEAYIYAEAVSAYMVDNPANNASNFFGKIWRGIAKGFKSIFKKAKDIEPAPPPQPKHDPDRPTGKTVDVSPIAPWLDEKMPGWRNHLPEGQRDQKYLTKEAWNVLAAKIEKHIEGLESDLIALLDQLKTLTSKMNQSTEKMTALMSNSGAKS